MRLLICCLLLLLTACSDDAPRALGTVERDRLTLTAPSGGEIAAVEVTEGQTVKAGQILLRLDPTSANARVAQRQAERDQANARLQELVKGAREEQVIRARAALAGASAKVREAQQSYKRTRELLQSGVAPQANFDTAKAVLDAAIAQQDEARQNLNELENGTRSEQLDQARAAVAAATAGLAFEQKALADLTLVAAQDAVVDTLPWRVGDRVAAGTQLIGLLATQKPFVRVYLPATWLDRVKVGTQVNILVDGRDTPIPGTVRNIRSQPAYTPYYALNERDRARLMYLTDIDIAAAGRDLPTGLALEVRLPQ